MNKQVEHLDSWDTGIVAAAQRQLQYLRELDADQSGEVEAFDISSALSGLGTVT